MIIDKKQNGNNTNSNNSRQTASNGAVYRNGEEGGCKTLYKQYRVGGGDTAERQQRHRQGASKIGGVGYSQRQACFGREGVGGVIRQGGCTWGYGGRW